MLPLLSRCSLSHLPPPGDEIRDLEMVPDSMLHSSSERPTFIDRLANSLTKRKRSTPQKFVGKSPVVEETSALSHSSSVSELWWPLDQLGLEI